MNNNLEILIIDNDDGYLELIARCIRMEPGYSVITANSCDSALETYRAQSEKFGIIITDLLMNDLNSDGDVMDGLLLLKKLADIAAQPVGAIILTGYATLPVLKVFYKFMGPFLVPLGVVQKQEGIAELLKVIKEGMDIVVEKRQSEGVEVEGFSGPLEIVEGNASLQSKNQPHVSRGAIVLALSEGGIKKIW